MKMFLSSCEAQRMWFHFLVPSRQLVSHFLPMWNKSTAIPKSNFFPTPHKLFALLCRNRNFSYPPLRTSGGMYEYLLIISYAWTTLRKKTIKIGKLSFFVTPTSVNLWHNIVRRITIIHASLGPLFESNWYIKISSSISPEIFHFQTTVLWSLNL